MSAVRRRLPALAAIWIAFQMAILAGTPIAMRFASAAALDEICTCPGGDHQTCPMHHGQKSDSHDPHGSAATRCVLQNACAPQDAALLALTGGLGVLPTIASAPGFDSSVRLPLIAPHAESRRDLPDAPPPRA